MTTKKKQEVSKVPEHEKMLQSFVEEFKVLPKFQQIQKIHETNHLQGLMQFQAEMNRQPSPEWLVTENVGGVKLTYVPISMVETLLDMFYFGRWATKNFKHWVVTNELCCSIELEVTNPLTGVTSCHVGVAAIPIMQDADASVTDLAAKKKVALKLNLPSVKSSAIKNAAHGLGKIFGRDIGRKHTLHYEGLRAVSKEETMQALLKDYSPDKTNDNDE